MACKNSECDGDGCLRDGPWGSNAPCHECNGTEPLTPEEKREFLNELEADLKAGGYNEAPVATALVVGSLPYNEWTEFGDFFNKPMSKSLIFQEDLPDELSKEKNGDAPWRGTKRVITECTFMAVSSVNKDKAVAVLRKELLKVKSAPDVEVRAFLATPSILDGVRPLKDGEAADGTYAWDLTFVPGKKVYHAFCFLHGYKHMPDGSIQALDHKILQDIGVTIGVPEGQVGKEINE